MFDHVFNYRTVPRSDPLALRKLSRLLLAELPQTTPLSASETILIWSLSSTEWTSLSTLSPCNFSRLSWDIRRTCEDEDEDEEEEVDDGEETAILGSEFAMDKHLSVQPAQIL